MQSSTDTQLQSALSQIAALDKMVAELSDQIDRLKERREHFEKIAIEEITTQRLDGVKAAGRSWRIEWTHSFSAPEARKEAVMEAAQRAGLLEEVTTVNTARLKALLVERGKAAGMDPRLPYSAGTEFDGLVGEYVRPTLRHLTVK